MEVSWTTFILEIINFLVLVWILKHFLYQPVLDVIARRRADIDKSLSDAEALKTEASAMREQYEGRLGDWERERQSARESLRAEIETQRRERLQKLDAELASAQQRAEVSDQRRLADIERKLETSALQQGAQFASRLLREGCGPETQQRLIQIVIEELSSLSPDAADAIRHQYGETTPSASVYSAFPIDDGQRSQLEQALNPILPPRVSLHYSTDETLLAGLRIIVGAWQLGSNIQDELRGFAALSGAELVDNDQHSS